MTVVANFTPPRGNAPALLNLDETETLFHEFGHALNNLFAQTRYKGTGMNSMELDFVEMPSQIMENWATEPECSAPMPNTTLPARRSLPI